MKRLLAALGVAMLVFGGLFITSGTTSADPPGHFRAEFISVGDSGVTGKAELQVDRAGFLHVVVHASGLIPGETYPNHIHVNPSIEDQGPVLVELTPLVANAAGQATAVTTLPASAVPNPGDRTIGGHLADGSVRFVGEFICIT